ncbi:hypothetical protein I6F07_19330 [Ensifer sp. IC4062]|nr:hypothetical protein [Ensifer sp. IC4062]MCA1442327.1 hypothetical protein [Ensifer sp. IC4062]
MLMPESHCAFSCPKALSFLSRCNPLGCKRFAAFFVPIAQIPAAAKENERHLFIAWRLKRNSAANNRLEWVAAEIIVAAAAIALRFFENAQGLA